MTRLYIIPVKDICNANCTFCFMNEQVSNPNKPQFLSIPLFKKSFYQIKDFINEVEITGGGEPTLHKNLNEIITILQSKNKYIKMYTNGFHLTNIPTIDEVNISRVHWDSKINNKFYRSKVHRNLDDTLQHYAHHAKKIRMQTILLKGAIDSKEKMEEFISLYGNRVDEFMIRTLFPGSSLAKELFVDYFPIEHPKIKIDTTLNNYSRKLYFIGSDGKIYNTFQY